MLCGPWAGSSLGVGQLPELCSASHDHTMCECRLPMYTEVETTYNCKHPPK